jgi:hypothetical protein
VLVDANGSIAQQLDVDAAFLYSKINKTIHISLGEGYRAGNKVAHLKRCIYVLKMSPRELYSHLTAYLRRHGFDISTFDPRGLWPQSDQFYITVYVDDLTLCGPHGHLIVTSILTLETELEVTNMGHPPLALGHFDHIYL